MALDLPLLLDVAFLDDSVLVTARGEIDFEVQQRLSDALWAHAARHVTLTLDLIGVTFIDSSGLRAIIDVGRWLDTVQGTLRILPSPRVRSIFQTVGLGHLLVAAGDELREPALPHGLDGEAWGLDAW